MLRRHFKFGRQSFGRRLLIAVLFVVLLVELSALVVKSASEAHRVNRAVELEANSFANLVTELIALPLWDLNYPVISTMLEGLNEDGYLISAQLTDHNGVIIAESDWSETASSRNDEGLLTLDRDISFNSLGKDEFLGRLKLVFSSTEKEEAIRGFIALQLLGSIFTLSVLAVLLAQTTRRLSAPLSELSGIVQDFEQGDFEQVVPSTGRTDEIGQLARALEHLRGGEREIRLLRRRNDIETQKEHRRMVKALSAANDAVILFDEAGIPVFRNSTAYTLLWGIDHNGSATDAFVDEIHGRDFEDALHSDTASDLTVVVQDKNTQTTRHLHIRMNPIAGSDNEFLGRVLIATDVTDEVHQRERFNHLASHDELTGLPNRRALKNHLDLLMSKEDERVAMILIDLDRFKAINDTHGHPIGDKLLCIVAQRICTTIGPQEFPVRMGGDEFAVVGTGPDVEQRLSNHAENLISYFSAPVTIDDITALSGMSVGLSMSGPADSEGASLMQHADLALYEAKRLGKGQLRKYNKELQQIAVRNAEVSRCLAVALEEESGLTIDLQLQTDIVTRQVTGFEALARLRPVDEAEIYPDEFIPVAEETGLIVAVTERVLDLSMRFALEIADQGFQGRVAVNISPQLFSSGLLEMILEAAVRTGCPSRLIELEVTESALLFDEAVVGDTIDRLRGLGYSIALDDFGTGYSSFGYLKTFSFDKLKIDRSITQHIADGSANLQIIAAISQIGRALGMNLVAEGVEDQQALDTLKGTDVSIIQGWIDGKPIRLKDMPNITDTIEYSAIVRNKSSALT